MRILWKYIPEDIRKRYGLNENLADNRCIYVKIKKGAYGLKQAAIFAFDNLVRNLSKHGYIHHVPIHWAYGDILHAILCVCVDDFRFQCYSKADSQHLLDSLRENYTYTVDWQGRFFLWTTTRLELCKKAR